MEKLISSLNAKEIYFQDKNFNLVLGDSFNILPRLPERVVDMIFADPPYFLSNGGITCSSGKMVCVNKGEWDKANGIDFVHEFNKTWLSECQRILKPNGTIWISGTMHNIFSVGLAIQELEYKILNNITWFKPNAAPNLSCRYFTHSTENIIWAAKDKKSKHLFNYENMKEENEGKQMRDVWNITTPKKSEKKHGKFPAQKPLELLRRIIKASTSEGDVILDPFNGSGTTGIAALELNRNYIGIDNEVAYLELSQKRYRDLVPFII